MRTQKQAEHQHGGQGEARCKNAIRLMPFLFRQILHFGGGMDFVPDRLRCLHLLQRRCETFAKPDFFQCIPATSAIGEMCLNTIAASALNSP